MNKKLWVTVTPLSKAMAMTLFVLLPFGGFYLGLKTRIPEVKPLIINKTVVAEPTPAPEPPVVKMNYQKGDVYVKDGLVVYIGGDGIKKILAKSEQSYTDSNANKNYSYDAAYMSPNKRFVLMSGHGWETGFEEIYDLRTNKLYPLPGGGDTYWLGDGRIIIVGGLGMGLDPGIYLSENVDQPWQLYKVGEAII